MQQVRCVAAHGGFVPGDLSEVPDGAEVSDLYWEPVTEKPVATAPSVVITADGPRKAEPAKAGA
jgi:hypothetical protein